jgi:hypothetical protein
MTAVMLRSSAAGPTAPTTKPVVERAPRSRLARPYVVVAVCCALLDAALGIWTISRSGYMIGDAAYRVSNARVILFSRDPHLAAIGMTWMPLATLATLPFTFVLQPFGLGWAAGALMSGSFGGGTVSMLAKIGSEVEASPFVTGVVIALFALNPVNIFWMGSAMMEAPALFFLCWACLAWIRWLRTRAVTDLAVLGLALGLGVLTRYEQLVVTMVFCLLAALACERHRRLRAIAIIGLPSIAVMTTWCLINQIIRGELFAFLDGQSDAAVAACGFVPVSLRIPEQNVYGWCQVHLSMWDGIDFGARRVLQFAPIALLGAPLVIAADVRRRFRSSPMLAVLLATLATPAFVTLLTWRERTSGNPRYFYSSILLAPLLCLLASSAHRRIGRAWTLLLVPAMALGVATSVHMELQELYAGIEHEETAISRLTGLEPIELTGIAASESKGDNVDRWREAAEQIDRLSTDDDLIAMDTSTTFPVLLFSQHLGRFAIPEDRDFEQLLSLAETRFTMVVVTGSEKSATGVDQRLSAIVNAPTGDGGHFVHVADLAGVGQLWRLDARAEP